MHAEADAATLQFFEQSDGRKVARLPGGKVVLADLNDVSKVKDGEWWDVRLRHRETYAIAELVGRATPPRRITPSAPGQAANGGAHGAAATGGAELSKGAESERRGAASAGMPLTVGGMIIEPENIIRSTDRVAIFIDGANMDGACRAAGYFLDYKKSRDYFASDGTFYAAFFYIADFTQSDPLQQRFMDFLSHSGFIVRRKPVKIMHDADTGDRIIKGNLDAEIILDMMNTVDNYDVAFLFSGDSDFERAVDLLRSKGKRIYVVNTRSSLSRELAYVADKPIFFIEDFRRILQRDESPEKR